MGPGNNVSVHSPYPYPFFPSELSPINCFNYLTKLINNNERKKHNAKVEDIKFSVRVSFIFDATSSFSSRILLRRLWIGDALMTFSQLSKVKQKSRDSFSVVVIAIAFTREEEAVGDC
ncbi:unnamed protein product [Vicia faba]|uniref:Uncharacterized protein n=1 Tax=Vicia faba TaxID=3906 RepID=A0AAV0ZIU5_VICFA|nr:unnamed protein product [Vicia faba]